MATVLRVLVLHGPPPLVREHLSRFESARFWLIILAALEHRRVDQRLSVAADERHLVQLHRRWSHAAGPAKAATISKIASPKARPRIVATSDTRAALVVCDELPDGWATPFVLENEVPPP